MTKDPLIALSCVLALTAACAARADTATFTPVADAYVDSSSSSTQGTNYGTATTLKVDSSPVIRSFLRFNVALPAGATITGATLRLYTTASSTSTGWFVNKVADNTWTETGVTWNNQPAMGAQIGSSGSWSFCPCWTQASLSGSNVAPGLNSFAVTTTSSTSKSFHSREGSNIPQLVVTYTPAALPSVSIGDASVTEGNSGTTNATFTVSLSAASAQTVTVSYATANGTATAPGDYTARSGQLSFAPNEVTKTVVVPVVGDTLAEPNETFRVDLSSPVNATLGDAQGLGWIVDDEPSSLTFPVRAAFYYPWYPETWTVGGKYPHDTPVLGYYDSSSQAVVDAHLQALGAAKVDVGIASWWGPNTHQESTRLPLLFNRTRAVGSPIKWTLYYEKEGSASPPLAELQADLDYIKRNYAVDPAYARVDGKPVLFVYNADDTTCAVVDRWLTANQGYGFHLVLKVFENYRACANQPDGWHQYAPAVAEDRQIGYSFSISPGFWKADETTPRLARDLARWRQNIRNMVAFGEPWQLITTFNEWGEGTATEEANGWATAANGQYLDALANDGAEPDPVIVAAGDIAGSWSQDEATAKLIDAIDPTAVLLLGDNVYNTGTSSEFATYYEPTWGRHKAKTYPSPGNHDHGTANLAGYCGYFGAAAHCQNGYGYYSFDLGNWHIISLDSGCSSPSSCADPMVAGSAMRSWLAADLAANTKPCTLVFWHHPRFSSGSHQNNTRSSGVWTELYDANVELVLNGHDHDYERFAPQTPSGGADATRGIRQFVVGTGGTGLRSFSTIQPNSEVRNSTAHGVLKLRLRPDGYDWEFVPIAGQTFTDSGSGTCH